MTSLPPVLSSTPPRFSLQLIVSFSLLITMTDICHPRVTIAYCPEVGIVGVNEGDGAVGRF